MSLPSNGKLIVFLLYEHAIKQGQVDFFFIILFKIIGCWKIKGKTRLQT